MELLNYEESQAEYFFKQYAIAETRIKELEQELDRIRKEADERVMTTWLLDIPS